jgi:membrane fusion protein (multidrug efflux system)
MADSAARRLNPQETRPEPPANVTTLPQGKAERGREQLKKSEREEPAALPSAEAQTENKSRPKRKFLRRGLLLLGPLVFIAAGTWIYLAGGRYVSTDNAYVHADEVTLTTDVPGIVAEVEVKNNQTVKRGQILFRLDDEPYRIDLQSAEAKLATVANQMTALQATYRQNLAAVAQAQTDVDYYDKQLARAQQLAKTGVASKSTLDEASRDAQAARDRLALAQRTAESTLAQLGGSADGPVEAHPQYQEAKAAVDKAKRDLSHTVITAPMAGVVANVDALESGEYLPAAQPAFSLVATDELWVDANLKESDLTYVKRGDSAEVTIDTYPNRTFKATVASISPATGAEFSVLPPQNASGNWVKVVQRIPVRLKIDEPSDGPQLRAGMSAEIAIDTGHKRSLSDLLKTVRRFTGV